MATPVDDNPEKVIEEAAREFVDARWRGEEPDVDEFVGQYPQLERQLRQRIQDIRQIDVLFDSLVQTDESDFAEVAGCDLVGQTVGNFEITEMIGRGGMGPSKVFQPNSPLTLPPESDSNARLNFLPP